ncbi:carbamoyl-phosphate synthase [Melittangium boletus]|uniref:Carbamoyl-phosphate synthase n=1 Tax=Melittangium boletus DSM 14713 TaxID=1294270 RepID=A0A250IDV1_9BACT|nr:carbamoyl-phosphate synthase [Melittangium boletus]ATB30034.1 carbamoyl-phosphate synthase [Melittangium boletus DSM 14713]
MNTPARPPILLTMADYYGTLAAARSLGRLGIPITMAESKLLAPARWSRYVTRRVECPDVGDSDAFLEWLLRFGAKNPGHVLYPTSDDMAWLFALHKDELAPHFRMYQPGVDAIYGLLNKQRLHDLCKDVGLDVPETWFPENEADLERVAAEARFPVLLKPQTQILFESHVKGSQVERASELLPRHREFLERNRYGRKLLAYDARANRPMVQAFYPEAAQNIFSMSGFVDRSGEWFVARGALKVLQRPRKLGIGLCFEEVPVDTELAEKVRQLCKKLGYFGTFEVEFIRAGGRQLLIDFNPRFYSQMGFDIARGMPLPLFVYEAASGHEDRLGEVARAALEWKGAGQYIYCHRGIFELLLRAQGLSGRLSSNEVTHWREWYARNRERAVDAVIDTGDWVPWMVDVAMHLRSYARHPRGFIRTMVLDR